MVEYMERVRRTYEELDAEKGTVRVNGGSTLLYKEPNMVDGRDGEGSVGEAGSMEDDRRHYRQRGATSHQRRAPVWSEEEDSQESGGQHGGVWRKNCTESLTNMVSKRLYVRWHVIELRMEGTRREVR